MLKALSGHRHKGAVEVTVDPALYSEGFNSGIRECDKFPLKVQGNVAVPAQLCSPTWCLFPSAGNAGLALLDRRGRRLPVIPTPLLPPRGTSPSGIWRITTTKCWMCHILCRQDIPQNTMKLIWVAKGDGVDSLGPRQ